MRAISAFCRDHGMSTLALRAPAPLRMRVSMSAIGSVIMGGSPAGLGQAGDLSPAREVAQTEPAHPEAPEERPRASAQRTTIVRPHLELGRAGCLHHETGLS